MGRWTLWRWLAGGAVWLGAVIQAPLTGHSLVLLVQPQMASDAQYGIGVAMEMGFAWAWGVLPAGVTVWAA